MSKLIPITVLVIALLAGTIAYFGGAFQRDEPMVAEQQEPILIEEQQPGVIESESAPAVAETSKRPAARQEKTTIRRETRTSTAAATASEPEVRVTRRSGKPEIVVASASGVVTPAKTGDAQATRTVGSKGSSWVKIPGTGVGLVPTEK